MWIIIHDHTSNLWEAEFEFLDRDAWKQDKQGKKGWEKLIKIAGNRKDWSYTYIFKYNFFKVWISDEKFVKDGNLSYTIH